MIDFNKVCEKMVLFARRQLIKVGTADVKTAENGKFRIRMQFRRDECYSILSKSETTANEIKEAFEAHYQESKTVKNNNKNTKENLSYIALKGDERVRFQANNLEDAAKIASELGCEKVAREYSGSPMIYWHGVQK